jgi:hypothetical protein
MKDFYSRLYTYKFVGGNEQEVSFEVEKINKKNNL